MIDSPAAQLEKFIVRLPDGMRERLKAVAERNRRSMNQEAVAALANHLDSEEHLAGFEARLAEEFADGPPRDSKFGINDIQPTISKAELDRMVEGIVIKTMQQLGVKRE
jgi:plasmid stability protein